MIYTIKPTKKFQKDLKLAEKRGYNLNKLSEVIKLIADNKELPIQYKDHSLKGNYINCRECHIQPDWLLIYQIEASELILYLMRTGSHSDLF